MNNKLGMNDFQMMVIEKKLVQMKLNLLNEYFSFNNEKLDLKFLNSLHEFLFCEFYYKEELGTRTLSSDEVQLINKYLEEIINTCIKDPKNIDKILELICLIWNLQPYIVGNTRTLIAYLKIINTCFLLNINVDVNKEIKSGSDMFKKENFVNQKQLTKTK